MNLKEVFKKDTINGVQVLGSGWLILFLFLLISLSILGALVIWVS